MYFLTINEAPEGVLKSQAFDVCRFLEKKFKIQVTLIAIISIRTFFKTRKQFKKNYHRTIILPGIPGINNWKKNLYLLNFLLIFKKNETVMARGIFAAWLALNCKKIKWVGYDGRAAYAAEWLEYFNHNSPVISSYIKDLEKEVVEKAQGRLAVSEKLVEYWHNYLGCSVNNYVVIPCTLNSAINSDIDKEEINTLRQKLGIKENEIVIVTSGSTYAWHGINLLYKHMDNALAKNPNIKLLMLTKPGTDNPLKNAYPDRVLQQWVDYSLVMDYLRASDYAFFAQEDSVSNMVRTPVRFAEYMVAGLPTIVSNNVGDYSELVIEKNCGLLLDTIQWQNFRRTSFEDRLRIRDIGESTFRKEVYAEQYKKLLNL
jgi:glycosyltransferase involved in cell wall biosynthesis